MDDIALSPVYAVGGNFSPNRGFLRDVEEGSAFESMGRGHGHAGNGRDHGLGSDHHHQVLGASHGRLEETNPLLLGESSSCPQPYNNPLNETNGGGSNSYSHHNTTNDETCNTADQRISFREILPGDRQTIQELFEEWFPVDYKVEFYDNLCNHKSMGDQQLYTLLATIPTTNDAQSTHGEQPDTVIACLLGCKLNASKLNEASRTLLLPGYQPKNGMDQSNDIDSSGELDQAMDELESCDPNACNNSGSNNHHNSSNGNNPDDEVDESVAQREVFYIMTLGVIEEYRKRGLASYLVERALQDQITVVPEENRDGENHELDTSLDGSIYEEFEGTEPTPKRYCETAYLHVIIQNQAAIRFYEKRGFSRLREIPDYYTIDEKKHNCYLYAKFFDKASVERRKRGQMGYLQSFCYNNSYLPTSPMFLVDLLNNTVLRWITSIWSSVSYYWAFDGRESGPAAAAKNK